MATTSSATADREIVISGVLGAPRERAFEFRVGGEWDFEMHGPDGTDGESRDDPDAFESVLTFEPAGERTRIVMRTVFPTKELRDRAAEEYHAIEGGEQTLRNLADYVDLALEQARTDASSRVTHLTYAAARRQPGP